MGNGSEESQTLVPAADVEYVNDMCFWLEGGSAKESVRWLQLGAGTLGETLCECGLEINWGKRQNERDAFLARRRCCRSET